MKYHDGSSSVSQRDAFTGPPGGRNNSSQIGPNTHSSMTHAQSQSFYDDYYLRDCPRQSRVCNRKTFELDGERSRVGQVDGERYSKWLQEHYGLAMTIDTSTESQIEYTDPTK